MSTPVLFLNSLLSPYLYVSILWSCHNSSIFQYKNTHCMRMALHRSNDLVCLNIPDSGSPIPGTGNYFLVVNYSDAIDCIFVTFKLSFWVSLKVHLENLFVFWGTEKAISRTIKRIHKRFMHHDFFFKLVDSSIVHLEHFDWLINWATN